MTENPKAHSQNSFSIHLDALRGLAALAVFWGHLRALLFVEFAQVERPNIGVKAAYFLDGFGHIAVMVFFVLSGYLISASVLRAQSSNRWSWSWYGLNRATRLYVVLIPALLLTAIWDHLGMRLWGHHTVYDLSPFYHHIISWPILRSETWSCFGGNLLFLQNFWVLPFGSNSPLWSLSNEFWYYILFPLGFLASRSATPIAKRAVFAVLALLVLVMVGKEVALYFLIWLMGTALALAPTGKLSARQPCLIVSGLVFVIFLGAARLQRLHSQEISDFLVALSFTAFLYCLRETNRVMAASVYEKSARFLSGISYTLYLVHIPILFFFSAYFMRDGNLWQPTPAHLFGALGIALVILTYVLIVWRLTEANTDFVRRFLQGRLAPRRV